MKKMTTTLLAAALTCSLMPGSAFALGRPATQSVRAGLEQRLGGEMMASDTLQARTNGMAGMFASAMNWDAVGSMHATPEFVDGNVSVSIDKGMLENRGGTAIVAKRGNVVTVQFPNTRPMQTACGGNAQQMLPDFLLRTAMDNSPQFGQQVPAGEMGQPGQQVPSGEMGQPAQQMPAGEMGQILQPAQQAQPGQQAPAGEMGQPGQPNQQTTNQPGQMGSMNSQPGQQMYNQQTTNQPGSMTNQPGQQMGGQPGGRR